jgi:malate synthase
MLNEQHEYMSVFSDIISDDASQFLTELIREFRPQIDCLMERRQFKQKYFNDGNLPDFCEETSNIRDAEWTVAKIPGDIEDRRVEITGPTDRKMIINAMNSGANVFMADFEDSLSPTWNNVLDGHVNLRDAVNKIITFEHPTKGTYSLNDNHAVLFVRPRGLHLSECHFKVDDIDSPASLFDFGLYIFHNGKNLIDSGTGPYFYLPKLEHYLEARLWNDIFNWSQDRLGIQRGSIRATVLIETLPAAFQMNEILWELRDHSAGLNCGRWDYIFSCIKVGRNDHSRIFPDRDDVTMASHNMRSYSRLLVQTCHRRGVHAMGGMAAQIPIRNDPEKNIKALNKVRADKLREVGDGHDGTWVAHPGLIQIAKEIFDETMTSENQIEKIDKVDVNREDLLHVPEGEITEKGLRKNINVGILYIESWLAGNGCVPLYNLMEDAATAEISRVQIWQWIKHGIFEKEEFIKILNEEVDRIKSQVGMKRFLSGRYLQSADLFEKLSVSDNLVEFLTLSAYEHIK